MKPGINRNVTEAEYHAFEAVSKSRLWKFAKNPRKWLATKDKPFKPTLDMAWGSLVDCLVLQPDELGECFAISPYDDFRSKEAREWRDAETREIITDATLEAAREAAEVIEAHDIAADILFESATQLSCLAEAEMEGYAFKSKCRIDILPGGEYSDCIVDLKTTASLDWIGKTAADFGYHVQAAFYLDLYNACEQDRATNEGERPQLRSRWLHIWQEREAPYEIAVTEMDPDDIAKGRAWYMDALALWCRCHRDGRFPSPWDGGIKTLRMPAWTK